MLGIMSLNAAYEYFMELCTLPDTHALTHKHAHTPHLTVGAMKCWDRIKIKCMGNKGQCSEKINLEESPLCRRNIKAILYSPLYFAHHYEAITAMFLVLRASTASNVDIIVTLASLVVSQISYLVHKAQTPNIQPLNALKEAEHIVLSGVE